MVILELIHAQSPERDWHAGQLVCQAVARDVFIRYRNQRRASQTVLVMQATVWLAWVLNHTTILYKLVIHSNSIGSHKQLAVSLVGIVSGDDSFKFLPYQLSMVG